MLLGLFVVAIYAAIFRGGSNWAPLTILVSAQGIWDVLFSTWAYNRPFILAISAVLAAWESSPAVKPGPPRLLTGQTSG